jgi:elongation factor P
MRIKGNSIKPGNVIEHQGKLWQAVKTQHTMPGKGGAFLQVELRNLRDGSKLNERFRSAEDVERVRLDQKEYQYLFGDDDKLTLMDTETFDQIEVNRGLVGEPVRFLQDGMMLTVESYEGEALKVELPENATFEVTDTEPVVKGQTAAASFKPATLENDVRVMVPPHIETGTKVVIGTADGVYVKRGE